ncbi:MAG: hypothetical protein GY710_24055 [Desulfobacteraceae bacterium]|nr:hypothetical protein [Desulfobacteraceae bacterium]
MTSIPPRGNTLKKAILWVSEQRKIHPGKKPSLVVDEAVFQFDLSPKDSEFLLRFVKEGKTENDPD